MNARLSERYIRELEAYALGDPMPDQRTDDHPAFFPIFVALGALAIFLAAVSA